MSTKINISTVGAPAAGHENSHKRARATASLVAALAGGLAVLVAGFIVVAGVSPGDGTWAWVALPVLIAVWLTGLWWRWDAPDRRTHNDERERRGF
jgi:hypothetical protein